MSTTGKRGKRLQLITNYVRVFIDDDAGIHEYNATFRPPIDNLEIRQRFLNQFESTLGESRMSDGMNLFLPFKLPEEKTVLNGFHPNNPKTMMKVTLTYFQRKPGRELVQFFNVLLRRLMTVIGKFELKRSFFDPDIKFSLPQYKLQIWPGICTKVEEQEQGLMLCLDTSYRVFRTDTVYDYLSALSDSPHWESDFKSYILGNVVVTQYNHFTYKVDDIDWGSSPLSTFDCKGVQMTYIDYYKSQYKLDIRYQNQPLLLSRVKVKNGYRDTEQIKIVSIIPELCYLTGMNLEHRNDHEVVKELTRHTYCTPMQKLKALNSFVERLNEIPQAKKILESWNVKIDTNMLEVSGRRLPGPFLQFGKGSDVRDANDGMPEGLYDAIPLKKWIVICSNRDVRIVDRFQQCYQQVCINSGIAFSHRGEVVALKSHNPRDFREALEDYADPTSVQFVIVVMPYMRREVYSVIKTICCSEKPIPSQIVLAKSIADGSNLMATVKNLALQINCKLGGSLWGLSIPLKERIMFVGIDVYHDVRKLQPSLVALIASMNNTCTKYFSKVNMQRIHQEIADNMQPLFAEALECFAEMNGTFPDRVIVFRDGGSISTTPALIEHEVKPMLSAIDEMCPQLQNFTYTVVSKRVPQRLFVKNEVGFIKNPISGTVVDEAITYPNKFDFYLVSQRKSQGIVNPTHYMVIYDRGSIKPDLIQQLAYSTTFMYYNWRGTIRIPAMIQYAHKLSSLVGQYTKRDPSAKLEKTLYYL